MLAFLMDSRTLAQAAERVHRLAQSLVEGVAAARREVTALEGALGHPATAVAVPDGPLGLDLDAVRLVALELADQGSGRDEVARQLRGSYSGLAGASLDGVLADVFG